LLGGDATVTRFQSWPGKPGASQICFPNRNSLALLSQRAVSEMDDEELCIFCRYFFNDTFIMDQNACSSPSGVVWFKDGGDIAARERFWEGLAKIANEEYVPDAYRAARKYETAALVLMDEEVGQETVMRHYGKNALYVLAVSRPVQESLIACLDFHPAFGIFFEWEIESLNALASAADHRTQTLTCLGPEPKEIANALIQSSCAGIDRIVPVGQALQMGFLWDGKDLLREMSGILTIGEE
ncbi:MAG: acyl-CoA reductase, partial [Peptoniphilaceae bacterium]|nr:acyl-CoA reductase [Peptoniphilaceae bacterium]